MDRQYCLYIRNFFLTLRDDSSVMEFMVLGSRTPAKNYDIPGNPKMDIPTIALQT